MDIFDYGRIIEESLQFAARKILLLTEKNGLSNGHHFYITFKTYHPGVQLSDRIKAKYPKEITIVIQHQYEDLKIGENSFSIILSFNNIKEKIIIPFNSLISFADPSVKFVLPFSGINADDQLNNQSDNSINSENIESKNHDNSSDATKNSNVIDFGAFKNRKSKKNL